MVDQDEKIKLHKHLPTDRLRGSSIAFVDATELGTESILYVKKFMAGQGSPDELVQKVSSFGIF
jgi:hypothetical protein